MLDDEIKEPAQGQEPQKEEKTFTQEQVNNLIAKETKKSLERVFKDLGVESLESAKDGLAKFKEIQDSQKSEQDKLLEATKKLQEENEKTTKELQEAQDKLTMLEAGIPKDKIGKYAKLVKTYEGASLQENLKLALEEFPLTITPPKLGDKTEGKRGSPDQEKLDRLRAIARSV